MLASDRAWRTAWNAHETSLCGVSVPRTARGSIMTLRSLQTAALWVFLGPLIIILGTIDVLTGGRSRAWLLAVED